MTDVYPAREEPIEGISGELIINAAKSMGHKDVHWVKEKKSVVAALRALVNEGDFVVTMGAGDIWRMGDEYVSVLQGEKIEV